MSVSAFSHLVKARIIARSGGLCEVRTRHCWDEGAQIHHRRARGMGGSKDPRTGGAANALTVCVPCHAHIESQRAESLEMGWLVRQGVDPASVPVFRYRRWVFLDDQGGLTPEVAS